MLDRLTVSVPGAAYDIILGRGLIEGLPDLLGDLVPGSSYTVVTDSTVARLHGEAVRSAIHHVAPTTLVQFPAGEWNKTRDTWAELTDAMLATGCDRDAVVVALGGGVAGDLGGFVAATFHRGVRFVQIPTTLLGMIDSSIGGKTGVDTPHGKNLVGAFHQPSLVIADVELLRSLPKHQLAAGAAEAVKHGAIADRDYVDRVAGSAAAIFAHDPDVLHAVVRRSLEIKAEVVAEDERETGRRAILNFGHTVAHAIETVTGFELLHGEAVAIGMLIEADIGARIGVTAPGVPADLRSALEALELPLDLPDRPPVDYLSAMDADKKNRAGAVHFSLLSDIGAPARNKTGNWTFSVDRTVIESALRSTS